MLWEKADPVTDRCQLPQAPSWGGKGHWKQQGNGGRDLNPEGNYLEWLPWLGDQSVAREAAGWHWGPRTGHSPRDWAEARGAPGLPARIGVLGPSMRTLLPVTSLHSRAGPYSPSLAVLRDQGIRDPLTPALRLGSGAVSASLSHSQGVSPSSLPAWLRAGAPGVVSCRKRRWSVALDAGRVPETEAFNFTPPSIQYNPLKGHCPSGLSAGLTAAH